MDHLTLQGMVGEDILARIPIIDPTKLVTVKLHGVEVGGLWIEYEPLLQTFMNDASAAMSTHRPIFFLPFGKVDFVVGFLESLALSEKAFGV